MPPQELRHLKARLNDIVGFLTKIAQVIDSNLERLGACPDGKKGKTRLSKFKGAVEAYYNELSECSLEMRDLLHQQVIWDDKHLYESVFVQGIEDFLATIYGRLLQLEMRALEDMESKTETQFRLERLTLQTDGFKDLLAGFINKISQEKGNAVFDLPSGAKWDKYGIYDPISPNKPQASLRTQPDAELAQVVTGISSISV
ncbi:MAG: hypothetical protein M1839_000587 [Geoglossum umbratile]|nr:MAG: hypothetical protein M1839_000587 [Geoglossum umbratile]